MDRGEWAMTHVQEARNHYRGAWPAELTSGVMFWKGTRITRDEFTRGPLTSPVAPPPPAEQVSGELPELPKYQHSVWVMLRDENREMPAAKMYFTAEQMRAYARAKVERALAESRAECDRLRRELHSRDRQIEETVRALHAEATGHKARAERLAGALREIATPLDCGCKPCHGHCRNDAWEWMQETARAALEQEPQE